MSETDSVKRPSVVMGMNNARTVLAVASGRKFVVWDLKTNKVVYERELGADLVPEPLIRCVALSEGEKLLCATAGDDKILRIWDTSVPEPQGTSIATPKRLTAVVFDKDGFVAFADKFGDVFRVKMPLPTPITEESLKPLPPSNKRKKTGIEPAPRAAMTPEESCILGHCSMLTAMAVSPDNTLIVTGDRDEHVRVSQYPEAYNIVSFCLGHLSSVFGTVFCGPDNVRLCSGSGDGSLRLWRIKDGEELACARPAAADSIVVPCDWCQKTNTIVAMVEGEPRVLLYTVDAATNALTLSRTIVAPSTVLNTLFDADGRVFVATALNGIQIYDQSTGAAAEKPFDDSALGTCSASEAKDTVSKYAYSLSKRFVYSRDGERPSKRPNNAADDD